MAGYEADVVAAALAELELAGAVVLAVAFAATGSSSFASSCLAAFGLAAGLAF